MESNGNMDADKRFFKILENEEWESEESESKESENEMELELEFLDHIKPKRYGWSCKKCKFEWDPVNMRSICWGCDCVLTRTIDQGEVDFDAWDSGRQYDNISEQSILTDPSIKFYGTEGSTINIIPKNNRI
ncbi:Hypothetical predicted protein [Mytilus galloprovincialis]|uniref:Uncharacterized protein n=1 Tax=Mytilus galloprovincialis TaxID=29158 RepID=A0A8B6EI72_MYTGA|nr:Hypothetical predicted protein [Mytilus galloprovincialis]